MNIYQLFLVIVSTLVLLASNAKAQTQAYQSYINSVGGCFQRECGLPFLQSASTGITLNYDGAKYIFNFELSAGETERIYLIKDVALPFDQSSIIEAINESVSPDLHLFARAYNKREQTSKTSTAKEFIVDIEITARLISSEQRKIGQSKSFANIRVAPEASLGKSNFRGTQQEFNIKNLVISAEFLSSDTLTTLKKEALEGEEMDQKYKVPAGTYTKSRLIRFYFQNGILKNDGSEFSEVALQPLNRSDDYCSILTLAQYSKQFNGVVIDGTTTLFYGQSSFGPIRLGPDGAKPDEGFKNSQSFSGSENLSSNKWQQYNKAGSGRNDRSNIKSIECTTHSLIPIKVADLQKALGAGNFSITYQVGNSLEVYLDNQFGLQRYLKGINSPALD